MSTKLSRFTDVLLSQLIRIRPHRLPAGEIGPLLIMICTICVVSCARNGRVNTRYGICPATGPSHHEDPIIHDLLPWNSSIRDKDAVVFVIALDQDFPEMWTPAVFREMCALLTQTVMRLSESQSFAVVFAENENKKPVVIPGWDIGDPDARKQEHQPTLLAGMQAKYGLITKIQSIRTPESPLQIHDALLEAVRLLDSVNGRKALLLITDSDVSDDYSVLQHPLQSGNPRGIAITGFYINMFNVWPNHGAAAIKQLSAASGGQYLEMSWP